MNATLHTKAWICDDLKKGPMLVGLITWGLPASLLPFNSAKWRAGLAAFVRDSDPPKRGRVAHVDLVLQHFSVRIGSSIRQFVTTWSLPLALASAISTVPEIEM